VKSLRKSLKASTTRRPDGRARSKKEVILSVKTIFGVFLSIIVIGLAAPAWAEKTDDGAIEVEAPWARATPSKAKVAVLYMTIFNRGGEADRLISMTTPRAGKVKIHASMTGGGGISMVHMETLDIPPGKTPVVLKPRGTHVMLIGLKAPLKKGQRFPMTLNFEKAGPVEIDVGVESIAAMKPSERKNKEAGPAKTTKVDKAFLLSIKGRKIEGDTKVIRVSQGEALRITWKSDEATDLHLHGYDIKAAPKPGVSAEMAFTAHATGRFPITAHGFNTPSSDGGDNASHAAHAHGKEKTLLYLEVYPR
jgi:periplasmic copper chaperone A